MGNKFACCGLRKRNKVGIIAIDDAGEFLKFYMQCVIAKMPCPLNT